MVQISVIIPCYNIARYISRCIDSIIGQECNLLEIIVVDDGSNDNLREVLEPYIDKQLVRYVQQENLGVSSARNLGLSLAQGEYIYFCDGDDYVEPSLFETLQSALQKFRYDIVMFGFNRFEVSLGGDLLSIGSECLPSGVLKNNKDIILEFLPRFMGTSQADLDKTKYQDIMQDHASTCVWRMLFRKSILDNNYIRFDTRLALGEDRLFISKSILYAESLLNIDTPLYNYLFCSSGSSAGMTTRKIKTLYQNRMDWIQSYSELRDEVLRKKHFDVFPYYCITCLLELQSVIVSLAHHSLSFSIPRLHDYLALRDVRSALKAVDTSKCSRYYRVLFTLYKFHLSYFLLAYRRACCLVGRL